MRFYLSDDYPITARRNGVDKSGNKWVEVDSVYWFTSFGPPPVGWLNLTKSYSPDLYPKYENYEGIEVKRVRDIPCDYEGMMGVPITFLNYYNPRQFEILGKNDNLDLYSLKTKVYTSEECRQRYFELFGKKGTYDLNAAAVINGKKVYTRLFIRNKYPNYRIDEVI